MCTFLWTNGREHGERERESVCNLKVNLSGGDFNCNNIIIDERKILLIEWWI